MLPKKNRVDRKMIEKIWEKGKFINSPNLTLKFLLSKDENTPRISFIAPKSIARKAVKRNYLRRLGYSVLGKHLKDFPVGILGIFVFKKYQEDILTIENEIKTILTKIN